MNSIIDTLKARGFFAQCTDEAGLAKLLESGPQTFYVGCDPTGDSLHIGHIVPFFAFRHLLAGGHRGIALIGGGTGRIGDPSGKTEMRKVLSYEEINSNVESIKGQLTGFLNKTCGGLPGSFDFANNADWLASLNYIDFLREIGSQFSVNRMLSFEAYKQRMETGLSFLEFNYQLLQSYDFLQLFQRLGCRLQIGGDDQWGNIVAGTDLIRRKTADTGCYGLTFPLITRADGKKMGKSEKGAVFLDPNRTPVYEFFQYWRNTADADLRRFLLMFTFLPLEEIEGLCAEGSNPNAAKERLALEVTSLVHSREDAEKALAASKAAFGGSGGNIADLPTVELPRERFEKGYNVVELLCDAGLCSSKSDARRLVQQGGAFVRRAEAELALADIAGVLALDALDSEGAIILRAGKKRYARVKV
jgi:tyrosyl-tRNA synthetase